ncbi:CHASE domain-containing protein [Labilibaculum sp.]|uniref:CHASE domain-containing hybrid sensor histidine kinase/response regulator n=1 Tax=Labilibaculum sp. TaxID=2060723 RepID=UPI00356A36AA
MIKIKNDWRVYLLLIIGISSTLFAAFLIKKDIDKIAKSEFNFESKEIANKIDLRLHAHARLLQSGVAFIAASDTVNRLDWREFVEKSKSKENLPGILRTGFCQIIPSKNLEKHSRQIKNEGFPDYKIWPEYKRDVYTTTILMEPFSKNNSRAFGYDMMTENVRKEAMERARDEDIAALSGKVLLVEETDTNTQTGNLMYLPVYKKNLPISNVQERRAAIVGWVYSPYRMNDLVRGILDDWDFKKKERALDLKIYDGLNCTRESLLFASRNTKELAQIRYSAKSIINFNGHNWSLVFAQGKGNIFADYLSAWIVFFSGIIISILILLLARSLLNTKYKAQQIAKSLTLELKNNENELKKSQKIAKLGSYTYNIETKQWQNSEILNEILGIANGKTHSIDLWVDLLHPDDREKMEAHLKNAVSKNISFNEEYRIIRHNDKQVRWVHELGLLELDEQNKPRQMIGTIRDITEKKLAEIEIQNISNRLQMATSAANIGVWDRDFKTSNIIWDNTMYELFGFIDKSIDPTIAWNSALHHEDKMRVQLEIEQAIKGEKEYNIEFRVIWQDQSIHHIMARGFISYDEGGKPCRMLGIDMDITEQKIAEKMIKKHQENLETMVAERTKELTISEQKLKKSFKDISDYKYALDESSIVAITDKRGVITYANDKFCSISKFERRELLGNTHKIINSGHHTSDFFINLWQTITQGEIWRGEIKNKAKDGSIYWVDSTIIPLLDDTGKPYQYIAIRFDITSKKVAEENIISAMEVADSANRAKSEFLANMSHEIRTPMNAVIGFSELLAKSVKNDKQRSQVESIRSSGKTLLKIINDILDLSKIEAGKIEIQPAMINLPNLMHEIENMFILKAKEKNIYFTIEYESVLPKILLLDEVRLRQILFNLIGNAIKFTDNGHVIVSLDAQPTSKENEKLDLLFRIEDTGMGIPKDQQEIIFEPFSQQKDQSTKYGGTGLGLSITKKLIENMGGRIVLESKLNKGSSFTVLLPGISISDHEIEIVNDTFDHSEIIFEKAKILLADDNSANRKLIKDLLECSNMHFIEAVNGEEAVALAIKNLPNIIFMDLRMPVMDGYEATKLLRENPQTKDIPVFAISASSRKIIYQGRSKQIFDEYLMKPLHPSDLFGKMKNYLAYQTPENLKQENSPNNSFQQIEKHIGNLPKLIDILETDFIPRHQKICKSQMIDHIEMFGKDLKLLAEENKIQYLLDYTEEICRLVDNFEIDKLSQSLDRFPLITAQLKNYLTKYTSHEN